MTLVYLLSASSKSSSNAIRPECPACSKTLYHRSSLIRHVRGQHAEQADIIIPSIPATPVKSKKLPCPKCELTFYNKWTLTRHIERLHRGLKCKKYQKKSLNGTMIYQ